MLKRHQISPFIIFNKVCNLFNSCCGNLVVSQHFKFPILTGLDRASRAKTVDYCITNYSRNLSNISSKIFNIPSGIFEQTYRSPSVDILGNSHQDFGDVEVIVTCFNSLKKVNLSHFREILLSKSQRIRKGPYRS